MGSLSATFMSEETSFVFPKKEREGSSSSSAHGENHQVVLCSQHGGNDSPLRERWCTEWWNRGGQRERDLLCNQEQSKVETWCKSLKDFCLILGFNSWISVSVGTSASQNHHHSLPVTHTVPRLLVPKQTDTSILFCILLIHMREQKGGAFLGQTDTIYIIYDGE